MRRRLPRGVIIGLAALVLVAGVTWLGLRSNRASSDRASVAATADAPPLERSIAVLPFVDMSEKHDQEYFADGMAQELLDLLAKLPQLKVIGRTSSFSFKGHNDDVRQIGEKLGATHIVEGSVRKSGDRVRISAQLVDARSGTRLWAGAYDRSFGDVLALQDEIASGIARALQLAVGADNEHEVRQLRNAEAYTFFLRGREAIDRGDAGMREAKTDFEQALVLDPSFFRAQEALALAYVEEVGAGLVSSAAGWPPAIDAAEKTLRLNPKSALAHAILGLEYATNEYEWARADAELNRALVLKPRDPYALYFCSWLAFDLGRHDEAVRLQDAALAIDPLNPDSHQNGAYIHYLMGDLDAAEREFRASLQISPTFESSHRMLGEILILRGRAADALKEMQAEPGPNDVGFALVNHALGRKSESDAAVARMEARADELGAFGVGLVYAYRNDRDHAFEWLEKAIARREISLGHRFKYDPMLASLRGDARYHQELREMHLPDGAVPADAAVH